MVLATTSTRGSGEDCQSCARFRHLWVPGLSRHIDQALSRRSNPQLQDNEFTGSHEQTGNRKKGPCKASMAGRVYPGNIGEADHLCRRTPTMTPLLITSHVCFRPQAANQKAHFDPTIQVSMKNYPVKKVIKKQIKKELALRASEQSIATSSSVACA